MKTNSKKYRIENRFFANLADARKYQRDLKRALPGDAVVTIFKAESAGNDALGVMYVPFA